MSNKSQERTVGGCHHSNPWGDCDKCKAVNEGIDAIVADYDLYLPHVKIRQMAYKIYQLQGGEL